MVIARAYRKQIKLHGKIGQKHGNNLISFIAQTEQSKTTQYFIVFVPAELLVIAQALPKSCKHPPSFWSTPIKVIACSSLAVKHPVIDVKLVNSKYKADLLFEMKTFLTALSQSAGFFLQEGLHQSNNTCSRRRDPRKICSGMC